MSKLLLSIDLTKRQCLVIGNGTAAQAKYELLRQYGASVTHVSEQHPTKDIHAEHWHLVALCCEDNESVATWHKHLSTVPLLYVSRRPELSTFSWPAIIQRDNVQIGISSQHGLASLTRWLRTRIETALPRGLRHLASLVERFQPRLTAQLNANQRRQFWESALNGPEALMAQNNNVDAAEDQLERRLNQLQPQGFVRLVGAGPGDPDLLTTKALNAIQSADVVVYDRLVSEPIRDLIRRDAEKIYAGKQRAQHHLSQPSINELLVQLAQQGKTVVRLKGGDPFIFGRGGEEIQALKAHGIAFEVIPGITAASGCASYAGIPLTHRDYAQSCVFITGQQKDGQFDINWDAILQPQQTVVIYMGLHTLPALTEQLLTRGMRNNMPIALIQQGTTQTQKVVCGTLNTIAEKTKAAEIQPPTLLIIGDVVALHDQLHWFEP